MPTQAEGFPRLPYPATCQAHEGIFTLDIGANGISEESAPVQMPVMDLDAFAKLRTLLLPGSPVISDVLVETRKKNTRAVKQALQLLFNNEYLGLTAYTLFIIPMLYVLYMPILQALRNEKYYPTHFVLLENAD